MCQKVEFHANDKIMLVVYLDGADQGNGGRCSVFWFYGTSNNNNILRREIVVGFYLRTPKYHIHVTFGAKIAIFTPARNGNATVQTYIFLD